MGIGSPAILFALRAVGRNAVNITSVGLICGSPYFVKQFVGRTELANLIQRGMHEQGCQTLVGQLHRFGAFHFGILKTVITKVRHKNFLFACTFQRVYIHLENLFRLFGMIVNVDITLFQPSVFL